ncbi:protein of unknown function [Tranquillimonas rosea]|uniref:DUF1127 domain-containing protein n=1 Tax=Tranquillimonas rosea TaxID=641238 RepID=A0A1H9WX30_9RHOB|nr:hypothetical protein [Tranquillimonas rosea]SES38321.1 protein of unknown function [Tranquillimonas rosea]
MTGLNHAISPRLEADIDAFLLGIGQGFNPYLEKHARRTEIAALDAASDEELARMGLTRADIPARVFRDLAD